MTRPAPEQQQVDALDFAFSLLSTIDAGALPPDAAVAFAQALSTTTLAVHVRDLTRLLVMQSQQAASPLARLVVPG